MGFLWKHHIVFSVMASCFASLAHAADTEIDFNRDIRPILSNSCFQCHGPDEEERKGGTEGLRLDTHAGATADLGGYVAVVPGDADKSDLIARIISTDPDVQMPPQSSGKKVSPADVELLRKWIQQGAKYSAHWSYVRPVTPPLPAVKDEMWPRNVIDYFILARLEQLKQAHAPEADAHVLARRVSLDLTGLPPTPAEVQEFLNDKAPGAYERYVDRLLQKPSYGEHWARIWLDLARYADSAGYADDPERTIWLFRDYVIRSLNDNKPFDQFTIEQIAGDLLPNPTPDQLIATAFHRNTLTNSEGGTDDEEFRNVAVVDRVSTTFSVWMGTTMACAQCHTHKFDPITHAEFFQVFAILNNTADMDRKDEAPVYSMFTPEQRQLRSELQNRLQAAEEALQTASPEILAARDAWESSLPRDLEWTPLTPAKALSTNRSAVHIDQDEVSVAPGASVDVYDVEFPLSGGTLRALRLDTLADPKLPGKGPGHSQGNFVISKISAHILPTPNHRYTGRFVHVSLPGKAKHLSLAEVQVFQGEVNLALKGKASQISTDYQGEAQLAIDGNTDGNYFDGMSVTHTSQIGDPWWEVDLGSEQAIDRISVWNRTDGGTGERLTDFQVTILNGDRKPVWKTVVTPPPAPHVDLYTRAGSRIEFTTALADYSQPGFTPNFVIENPKSRRNGWAVGGATGQDHAITLLTQEEVMLPPGGVLTLKIEQSTSQLFHTLGRFRVSMTSDERAGIWGEIPTEIINVLNLSPATRTPEQTATVLKFFVSKTPLLQAERKQIESLKKQIEAIRPVTVPVCEELPQDKQRVTRIQLRGNYLDLGEQVEPGTPAVFPPIPANLPANRLGLAHWLVADENPLTPRVIANRYWEQIFGIGLVSTSEDFGNQGELPSHPELLDWLATELIRLNWDSKAFLKLLVTSATYRQSSRVIPEQYQDDPDNRLLARGPRFRLSAENIRDQALALSGLLSPKMYGPPVKPPQPNNGLNAAFGGSTDWKTSSGEDKHRRAIYTTWRRSNPYPSMATFDAPNREVCTVRRVRTNTPLQALVTLNDPVFIEAAQALARRIVQEGGVDNTARMNFALTLCLSRPAQKSEVDRLLQLLAETQQCFKEKPAEAASMATDPLGPLPANADPGELAAWTVVANVILNLDELLMKR